MKIKPVVTYFSVILITFSIILGACSKKYTPKPRGYFRIDLPEKEYLTFDENYPFSFKYANCSKIKKDSSLNANKYWININYPEINGKIHISYLPIQNNFAQIVEDTRKLAYKHTIKADAINEIPFSNTEKNIYGIVYEIEGNAASSVQFFVTDSTKNYLRGALYFNAAPNKDSLAPVINYIKEDIGIIIESFEWN